MYHCHNLMHEDNMMMLQYIVTDMTTGATEDLEIVGTRVFPSPTTGQLTYESATPVQHARLIDALGREVWKAGLQGATTGTLDLGPVPAGTYVLLLHGAAGSTPVRVVKE